MTGRGSGVVPLRPAGGGQTLGELLNSAEQPAWMAQGLCASGEMYPDAWWPGTDMASVCLAQAARRICRSCPVRAECLAYALGQGEEHGIWGGTTPRQRRRLRREAMRSRRQAS